MDFLKSDIEPSIIRNIIVEACAIHALRKEIQERIEGFYVTHLSDEILSKGKIRVKGETVSTKKMLDQLRLRFNNTLDEKIIDPIVDILKLRKRAMVCGWTQELRVPQVIQALSTDERKCYRTDVGKDSVIYFIENNYMVIASNVRNRFNVIALHGLIRNLLSDLNPSQYHTLTPQSIYLGGRNVETLCGSGGAISMQRLIMMNQGTVDVRLRSPTLSTLINSADGLNKRNWNLMLNHYGIVKP